MTTEPNRVDAGVPTGGQFATKIKSDDVPTLGVSSRRPELDGWPVSLPEPELDVKVGEGGTISTQVKVNGKLAFDVWNPADDIHDTESDDFEHEDITDEVHDAAKAWAFTKHNEIADAIRADQEASFRRMKAGLVAKATGTGGTATDEELSDLIDDSGSAAREALRTTELASASLAARKIVEVLPEAAFAEIKTDSWENGTFVSGAFIKDANGNEIHEYAEGDAEEVSDTVVGLLKNLDAEPHNSHWAGAFSTGSYGDELYTIDLRMAAAWAPGADA